MRQQVEAEIKTTFGSHFIDRVSLAGALDPEVIAIYGRRATGQKYLIEPQV